MQFYTGLKKKFSSKLALGTSTSKICLACANLSLHFFIYLSDDLPRPLPSKWLKMDIYLPGWKIYLSYCRWLFSSPDYRPHEVMIIVFCKLNGSEVNFTFHNICPVVKKITKYLKIWSTEAVFNKQITSFSNIILVMR